ncbi:MAG: hypothetical protein FWG14_11305 [Peptococcaceae bacterium]|nr:hypothetical protein [Peptococcaceae bacterium]
MSEIIRAEYEVLFQLQYVTKNSKIWACCYQAGPEDEIDDIHTGDHIMGELTIVFVTEYVINTGGTMGFQQSIN